MQKVSEDRKQKALKSIMSSENEQLTGEPCLICGKPVPDYEPVYCCNGFECGCRGMPRDPCCCSLECEDAVFRYIGEDWDTRRQLAGIAKWNGNS